MASRRRCDDELSLGFVDAITQSLGLSKLV
jgi:hypothetical protein